MGMLQRAADFFRARSPRATSDTALPRVQLPRHIVASLQSMMLGLGIRGETARFDELQAYVERAWVYAAARRKSMLYAMPTLRVYEGDPEGDHKEVAPDHPLRQLLANPNSYQSGYDLWEDIGLYLALKGEALIALGGDTVPSATALGQPSTLSVMNPGRVEAFPGTKDFIERWVYTTPTGTPVPYRGDEVIQIRFRNPRDDYRGLGHVKPASDAIEMEKGASNYNLAMLDNMCEPGGFIEYEGDENILTPDQVKQLLEAKEGRHRGVNRAGLMTYLMPGEKWKAAGFTPREMQYREMRTGARAEILATFGLPPIMVGVVETATYNNAIEQRKSTWEETMMPELAKVAASLNSPTSGLTWRYGPNIFVKWDLSKIPALQENTDAKHARAVSVFEHGGCTRNELRFISLGLGPEPGLDDYFLLGTLIQAGTNIAATQDRASASRTASKAAAQRLVGWDGAVIRQTSWKLAMMRWTSQEPRWVAGARDALSAQARRVLERYDALGKAATVDGIFPRSTEAHLMQRDFRPLVRESVRLGAEAGLRLVNQSKPRAGRMRAWKDDEPDFEVDQNVLTVTARLEQKLVEHVDDTTWQRVRDELADGQTLGESTAEIRERLNIALGERRSEFELNRIARTEIGKCSNAGAMLGYRQSGVVDQTEWVATQDDRTRDDHAELDGAVAPLGSTTWTLPSGGARDYGMEYPGDPNGGVEQVVNCRCLPIPVIVVPEEVAA